MTNNFWYIQNNFTKARSTRIGASDIAACIPDPEHPTESLAGYERTALTVWEEKTGRTPRTPAGLAAEMGHWNEPKATELFMRDVFGQEIAAEWLFKRMTFETLKTKNPDIDPRDYQEGTILHNVQWYNDEFIVHPDGVYESRPNDGSGDEKIKAHGLTIDLSRPFLIEGKSARYFAARRPAGSIVRGYDPELKTWQGIPLKHYVQIQYQLAMFEIDVCYLPLLSDTSSFHVWQIKANRKRQNQLIDLAGRLSWYIEKDKPPKELAINQADIKKLYPTINEDFAYVTEEEREKVLELARMKNHADEQEKIWKAKKEEATDALGVLLRDRGELRDENGSICRWVESSDYEKLLKPDEEKKTGFLKQVKDVDPVTFRYLKKKGYVNKPDPNKKNKYVKVTLKEDE